MEINKTNLKQVADFLKIDENNLETALTTAEGKIETEVKHFFTDSEKGKFEKNIQKAGYDKGETIGREMLIEEIKNSFNEKYKLDIETNNIDEIFEKVLGTKTQKLQLQLDEYKSNLEGDKKLLLENHNSKIAEFENKISAYDALINDNEVKYKNEIDKITNRFLSQKSDNSLISAVNNIPFAIPVHIEKQGAEEVSNYLDIEKNKFITMFKSLYNLKYVDNNLVVEKDNEIVKDKLQSPVKFDTLLIPFAKTYNFSISNEDETRKKRIGNKNVGEFIDMNRDEFYEYLKEKNISIGSNEGAKLYSDWKKAIK